MVGVGKITQETDFIVGNPQITFFKAVYRRHSHFAIQQKTQSGDQPNVNGKEIVYTINDGGGQLLHRCWLEVDLNVTSNDDSEEYMNWTNNTGHAFVEQCKLKINNNEIDTHSGVWLDVYNELNDKDELEHMGLNKHAAKNAYLTSSKRLEPLHMIIPFKFWFNKNPGLALPLCSIDRASVDFVVKYRKLTHLVNTTNGVVIPAATTTISDPRVTFFSEIIHLDIDETRRFTQNRHEYLIETLQEKQEDFESNVRINFSHPVKELVWVIRHQTRFEGTAATAAEAPVDATKNISYNSNGEAFNTVANNLLGITVKPVNGNDYFDYSCGSLGTIGGSKDSTHGGNNIYGNHDQGCEWFDTFQLDISGETQFDKLKASFLRTSLPAQYGHKVPNKHVYCYSFSLNPDEYSPSGVKNLSNSSHQLLRFTDPITTTNSDVKITIFAVNYNIFRIMNGKAALIFSQ